MSPLFEFEQVSLLRDDRVVLDAVDLSIPSTGVTALVGRSGAGKSTLLRCCNRLEHPTRGRVLYRGDDIETLDPLRLRRSVAMVFQAPTVFGGSGLDDLRVADPLLDHEAASALVTRVGLGVEVLGQRVDSLSGGEAQRLCLARALATRPAAMLADEPTSALDGSASATLEALALELAADGIPIVWVTHDVDQVERIADHVVELDGGAIRFSGPARACRNRDGDRR